MGKKVVIVGPAYPLRGGLATFNERLARAFVEEGHEVTILTFKLQYPGFLFPGKTQFSAAQEPDDLKIDVAINSINPLNWIRVGRKYKKLMPDVVRISLLDAFYGAMFRYYCTIYQKEQVFEMLCNNRQYHSA